MAYKYGWWSYAKWMIRRYPEYAETLAAYRDVKITPAYSPIVGSRRSGRSTEDAAIRELSPSQQREFEAVDAAIRQTRKYKNGEERLKLLTLVFWKRTHTLPGAALQCYVSYQTARDWHREFIRLVAFNFGLLDKN